MGHLATVGLATTLIAAGAGGCDPKEPPPSTLPDARGTGSACGAAMPCGGGLVCIAGTCGPEGSAGPGQECSATRDCATGLYCAEVGLCAPAGTGTVGDPCGTGAECERGLYCESVGLTGQCQAGGAVDLGGSCTTQRDCLAGLACAGDGTCQPPAVAFPPFTGVACEPDAGPFKAFFQLPRPGAPLADFFRLPFPNDARVDAGVLDLSDFPRPGPTLIGFDLVGAYADALAADFAGFSSVAPVTFRFSQELDFDTLGANGANLHYVDVTVGAPGFGNDRSRGYSYDTGRGKLLCQQSLAVSNALGEPLEPGHTYAVFVTTAIRSRTGEVPTIDADLQRVLGPTAPADAVAARVWTQYAGFRQYLTQNGIAASTIAAAAVFTTGTPLVPARRLAQAVLAEPVPALTDLTLCDGVVSSPCGSDAERACGDSSGAFWEIHGRYRVPNYQAGTIPFARPADGGAITWDAGGAPVKQGDLAVCFALTIPKATAPVGGWPMVVHAHGTGGGFRAAITGGIAAALATAATPAATFTFDGIHHGQRRGGLDRDPDGLVFNVTNPRAARDNHLQGAVDVIAALRVAQVAPFTVSGAGAGPIDLDATRVAYFGHSQGSNVGIPALAVVDLASAAVLSGAGSHLAIGILGKKEPVDAKAGLELLLGEPLGGSHPMMVVWQTFFDPIDPIGFAPALIRRPPAGVASKHVLQTWSATDTYSPKDTLTATARAAGLQLAPPQLEAIGVGSAARPVLRNRPGGDGQARTAVVTQYATDGSYDGHFVATRNAAAQADWLAFLTSALATGAPTVP